MSNNYAPLNRSTAWATPEKQVIKKLFLTGEAAALGEDAALISRSVINRILAGKLGATQEQDLRALFIGIRAAIAANDSAYDLQPHFGADRWTGNQRRIIKALAQSVVDQIPAA